MYIDWESVYSSCSAVKQTRKHYITFFIPVDFIHSSHHRLKKSNFILEKNRFRSIDLTCWRSTNPCVYDSYPLWTRVLETFFGPRVTGIILKILYPFIYPGFTVMSSRSTKNSFTTVRHVFLPRWQRWQAYSFSLNRPNLT